MFLELNVIKSVMSAGGNWILLTRARHPQGSTHGGDPLASSSILDPVVDTALWATKALPGGQPLSRMEKKLARKWVTTGVHTGSISSLVSLSLTTVVFVGQW